MKIHYNPELKELSRELRNNSTLSEVLLWKRIRGKKIKGLQFARQKPIGNYIVDFYCGLEKLVIEIDGNSHNEKILYDQKRKEVLEKLGLRVLCFSDKDVKTRMDYVIKNIEFFIENNPLTPFTKGELHA